MRKQEAVKAKAKSVKEENEMEHVKLKPTPVAEKKAIDEAPAKPVVAQETKNLPATVAGDGFDDSDGGDNRIIRGVIMPCVDGIWSCKDGTEFPPEESFLAMATTQALQRWQEERVVESISKIPGRALPDVKDLNDAIPKGEWEAGINGPRAPWQHVYVVYLLRPVDASIFTVVNNTVGMRICYERLSERVKWMRSLRGEKIFPLVVRDKKPMTTQFGTKLRPELTIIGWRDLGGEPPAGSAIGSLPPTPTIGQPVEPVTTEEALNDEIPL
jgi:hypothetical protein